MMNPVRSAHAWAALLLLAAACDGGGGGGDDERDGSTDAAVFADAEPQDDADVIDEDAGEPEQDGAVEEMDAGGGEPDAEVDAVVPMMDADMLADTSVTPDTSTGGDDSGGDPDTGTDAGPSNCAQAAITASAGGEVTSTDERFVLTLAPNALSADATVRVCAVPTAEIPAGVQADGRIGDVYAIETTATFSARATFRGHSALPGPDSADAFDPVTVRTLPTGGSVSTGTDAVLSLSKRIAAPDSVSTLAATITAAGHVYVKQLEADDIYQVQIASPKTSYVTGEVIDLSAVVTVGSGTPSAARTLEAEVQGCDLEPMNTPIGVAPFEIAQSRGTRAGCGTYTTVTRTTTNIPGGSALTSGATVDLRNPANSPPRLYCQRPGPAWAATRLSLKTGTTADLTIEKRLEVTCSYSGDWVAVWDEAPITRGTMNDFVRGTTYTPRTYAAVAPSGMTFEALADEPYAFAVRYSEPVAVLSNPGAGLPALPAQLTIQAQYRVTDVAPPTLTNRVVFNYMTDRYTPTLDSPSVGFFEFRERAQAAVSAGGGNLDCYPPAPGQLDLRIGNRNGASSTIAVLDSAIEAIVIRARFAGAGGAPATIVQRFIDATRLVSHQPVQLLTDAQQTAMGAATASEYAVGLFRVAWEEDRKVWPDGRVVPVACGTVLMFEAADVAP